MKQIRLLLILLVFLLSGTVFADHLKVNVGVYQNYPLMFRDDDGKIQGFGFDILTEIAKRNNWEIEYHFDTWSNVFNKVKTGELDLTFPVGFTLDRTKIISYNSQNIISNWGQIFLRKGAKANSILDLNGKRIAVLKDDVYYTGKHGMNYLAEAFNIYVDYYVAENYGDVLKAVSSGYADAGLVNRFYGLLNAKKYNLEPSTILIHPVEVRFALTKDTDKSFSIIRDIDEYISEARYKEGSVYYNSYSKWVSPVTDSPKWDNIKVILLILIVPALIILSIFLILRAEVRRKTKEISAKNQELETEIEERKKIELELKESQEKYSTLFNTSYNPVAIIAEDGSLVDVNGELVSQFGYDREELLKMYLEMLVVQDHVARVKEIIDKMHKTKKWSFELDFVKSWGDVFNSEISASRLEISGKTFIQLVIMDITSRKKASELLNRRQEYLEKKVDEEVQKRRQNERLMMQQSKMAAMGQMMSAIAHQWRQPLNSIAIYIQDFEDAYKYNELSEEYIHDLVVQSMKQINFMSKTIDDFKNFFKPDKDEVLFEVCAETLSAISLLGVQLVRNNISLILNCHGKEVDFNESGALECSEEACTFVKGFPNEYKQVLLNLVQNARDAVVESLSDGEDGGRIVVGVEEKEETVKIYVADNGVGIPQDVAERIFEPYFTTKEEGQGTGVGLYMSKIIIEQNMKGRLYFENNNPGTKFVIEIRKQIDSA
jgi:PAS domain S-box-containing protein